MLLPSSVMQHQKCFNLVRTDVRNPKACALEQLFPPFFILCHFVQVVPQTSSKGFNEFTNINDAIVSVHCLHGPGKGFSLSISPCIDNSTCVPSLGMIRFSAQT